MGGGSPGFCGCPSGAALGAAPSQPPSCDLTLCLGSSSEAFQKGGRKGAKKVMIVITDGESHDSPDLEKVIQLSERDNVTRYAVAVSPAPPDLPRPCLPATLQRLCHQTPGDSQGAFSGRRALGWASPYVTLF